MSTCNLVLHALSRVYASNFCKLNALACLLVIVPAWQDSSYLSLSRVSFVHAVGLLPKDGSWEPVVVLKVPADSRLRAGIAVIGILCRWMISCAYTLTGMYDPMVGVRLGAYPWRCAGEAAAACPRLRCYGGLGPLSST